MKNEVIRLTVHAHYLPYPDFTVEIWRMQSDGTIVKREYAWGSPSYVMPEWECNHRDYDVIDKLYTIMTLIGTDKIVPGSLKISSCAASYSVALTPEAWEY